MKRKISLLLCLLLGLLCFTGCAKEEEPVKYDEAVIGQTVDFLIEYCNTVDDVTLEQWNQYSEFTQNYQIMTTGLQVTPESLTDAVTSWKAGIDECGAYISHGDFSYEADADGVDVSMSVEYENKNAEVVFSFDEKSYLETLTVSAENSMSEILKKSGLNTLLGMGTVFAVLIFISIIISLFGFIPKIEAAFRKPKEALAAPAVQEAPAVIEETVPETDDLELIAVISAAIAACEGTSTDGFVVRSIRRRPSNKWKA